MTRIVNENPALSMQETRDLLHMCEEEKLARDIYLALYEQWGLQIFSNIAQSEQRHTDALKHLIARYDLPDSVTDNSRGVFRDIKFQSLHDALVAQGSASLVAALHVGAAIEELDIKDLQMAMARTASEEINGVYANLLRGSHNHLRAFGRQLDRKGERYRARYLSQEEVDNIMTGGQGWSLLADRTSKQQSRRACRKGVGRRRGWRKKHSHQAC